MKRLLRNGKKRVAGLVLTMMAVCMVSSVAQELSIDMGQEKRFKRLL